MPIDILIVDDEASIRRELSEYFNDQGYCTRGSGTLQEARQELEKSLPDIVLLDLNLPDGNGFELLHEKQTNGPDYIVVTGRGDVQTAVRAIREGATDYFPKPISLSDVEGAVRRTLRHVDLKSELQDSERIRGVLSEELAAQVGMVIGRSDAIRHVMDLAQRAAQSVDTPVLISGPSGVGKELVARTIHFNSPRRQAPFSAVNCAAIPETLMESELFGHVKGAFTGANTDKAGIFENAGGGTVFLDEIGELHLSMQPKLLRFLEEKTVKRIGANEGKTIDVRVIAATNRDLYHSVDTGEFRRDLYYRINTVEIDVPALAERTDDIPILAEYFAQEFCRKMGRKPLRVSEETKNCLLRRRYPGNVRELRNLIERGIIFSTGDTLELAPERSAAGSDIIQLSDYPTLAETEQRLIQYVMKRCGQNISRASEKLGISRFALQRRLRKMSESDETH